MPSAWSAYLVSPTQHLAWQCFTCWPCCVASLQCTRVPGLDPTPLHLVAPPPSPLPGLFPFPFYCACHVHPRVSLPCLFPATASSTRTRVVPSFPPPRCVLLAIANPPHAALACALPWPALIACQVHAPYSRQAGLDGQARAATRRQAPTPSHVPRRPSAVGAGGQGQGAGHVERCGGRMAGAQGGSAARQRATGPVGVVWVCTPPECSVGGRADARPRPRRGGVGCYAVGF